MADFTSAPDMGDHAYESEATYSTAPRAKVLSKLTNLAGALVSLALIAGIGVWGYKLLVRDVSGIPVVRAAKGEMRIRPEEPGGERALHQGLSVNAVAAVGTAARPADELRLAPRPVELTEEDHIAPAAMVAAAPQEALPETPPDAPVPDVSAALQSGNVDDLVAQLTEGVTPMTVPDDSTDSIAEAIEASVAEAQAQIDVPVAEAIEAPGVRNSLRPRKRPVERAVIVPASLTSDMGAAAATAEVDAATLPKGTRLAQLGAYDSPEVAREQWDQLQTRFSAYLDGKQRVVQKATSGGRVFYRLRAHGFQDIGDARRFCSALVAENADCIPVVTR